MCKSNDRRLNVVLFEDVKYGLYVLLFCMVMLLSGNTAFATAQADEGAVSSDTETTAEASPAEKEETGQIITKDGKKYYQYENGKKAKKQFITVKGKTYYFGKDGAMEKGWMKKGGSYYYFDRKTGVQKTNCKVDGIKIKKSGKAEKTDYNKKRIDTMLKAKSIVNKVTKQTDSKSQKLKKVFDWVLKHPYKRHRILAVAKKQKGWEMTYANDIFKTGNGCCVSESSALAFLAHECGYRTVYICDDTAHAWVEIDGKVYDTLFAEGKDYNKYYNSSYKTAGLHCVGRLKIKE